MARKKVVVFTVSAGGGHLAAAEAVQRALMPTYDVTVVRPIESGAREYNQMMGMGWNGVLNILGSLQDIAEPTLMPLAAGAAMDQALDKIRPDLVISVLPCANQVAWSAALRRNIPMLVVPTDLDIHHFVKSMTNVNDHLKVALPFADDFFAAQVGKQFTARNLAPVGYPVRPEFTESAKRGASSLVDALRIQPGHKVVLMMAGAAGAAASTTLDDTRTLLEGLRGRAQHVHLVCFCGRNDGLRRALRDLGARIVNPDVTLHALGFTNAAGVSALMGRAHVILTKSGGSTVNEAIAMRLPMLFRRGSEQLWWEHGNSEFVLKHGLGAWTGGGAQLVGSVSEALQRKRAPLSICPARDFARNLTRCVNTMVAARTRQQRIDETHGRASHNTQDAMDDARERATPCYTSDALASGNATAAKHGFEHRPTQDDLGDKHGQALQLAAASAATPRDDTAVNSVFTTQKDTGDTHAQELQRKDFAAPAPGGTMTADPVLAPSLIQGGLATPAKRRVLILSSDAGNGHAVAAQAVQGALGSAYDTVVERPFDLDMELPTVGKFRGVDVYNVVQSHGPALALDLLGGIQRLAAPMGDTLHGPVLRELLDRHKPDLVISVVPMGHGTAYKEARARHIPMVVLPTDLDFAHFVDQIPKGAPGFKLALPFAEMRTQAPHLGESAFAVTGYPVREEFRAVRAANPLLDHLRIGACDRVVMIMMGGGGAASERVKSNAAALANTLGCTLAASTRAHVVCVCGRNDSLRHELAALVQRTKSSSVKVHALGLCEAADVAALMGRADVLITKPGGATVNEALLANVHQLYDRGVHVPFWELGNAAYAEAQHMGEWVDSDAIVQKVAQALRTGRRAEPIANPAQDFSQRLRTLADSLTARRRARSRNTATESQQSP